jgi:hypothetical protein
MTLHSSRVPIRRAAVAVVLALAAFGLTAPAGAAPTRSACPAAYPVDQIHDGMKAKGYTVAKGTTIEPFNATVLGVLEAGPVPGVPLIMVTTSSKSITEAGGVWQGMSGSPVYAQDGRLLGAVAYGLGSEPSPIIGLTPASAMYEMLTYPDAAPAQVKAQKAADTVQLTGALRDKVAAAAGVSAAAAGTLSRLPVPVTVSGFASADLPALTEQAATFGFHGRLYAGSAAGTGEPGDPAAIEPGSNIAFAVASGDAGLIGTGTTTAVCDGAALSFGHPFQDTGQSSYSAHNATAVYIQPDGQNGPPAKIANAGGIVGTATQDRAFGQVTRLGAGPASIPIDSQAHGNGTGLTRTGHSEVGMAKDAGLATFLHISANLARVHQKTGEGTTWEHLVIKGTRANGQPFTVDRDEISSDRGNAANVLAVDTGRRIDALIGNRFEAVRIDSIRTDFTAEEQFKEYALGTVKALAPDGTFQEVDQAHPVQATAGGTIVLHVTLTPYQNRGTVREVEIQVPVPADAAGAAALLDIEGGVPPFQGFHLGGEDAGSFDELVAQLGAQYRRNGVVATLRPTLPGTIGQPPVTSQGEGVADQPVRGNASATVAISAAQ